MADSTPGTDDGGPADRPPLDLGPTPSPAPATRRRGPIALWGVLAVLALGAGMLVVQSRDDDPPRLPIALGSSEGAGKRAAPAVAGTSDLMLAPSITYVAGDDLPALGGTGAAYRLGGDVSPAAVGSLGRALGLSGTPTNVDGGWHLDTDHGTLDVSTSDGGSWWFSSMPADTGSGSSSSGGAVAVAAAGGSPAAAGGLVVPDASPPTTPVTTIPATTIPADSRLAGPPRDASTSSSPITCGGGEPTTTTSAPPCVVVDPVPPRPSPPADLPSSAEARRIALDLLSSTGMDLTDASVTVDGPGDGWSVTVEPKLDGLAVSGLTASVSVGSKGAIGYASGYLDHPARLGDYPVLDTRATIDRLNRQDAGGPVLEGRATPETAIATPAPPDARPNPGGIAVPLPTTTVVDGAPTGPDTPLCETPPADPPADEVCIGGPGPAYPTGPAGPVEPQTVVLHKAERVLLLVPASDTSGDTYLVPGYRFTGDGDTVVEAVAVDDDSLVPPAPILDVPASTVTVGDAKPQQ